MGFDPATVLDMSEYEVDALLDIYVEMHPPRAGADTTTTTHVNRRKRP